MTLFQRLLTAMFFFALVPAVHAELVTFEITARVYDIQDPGNILEGTLRPGGVITGIYTFETSTVDTDPSAKTGHYPHSATLGTFGFNLLGGGHNFKTDPEVSEFVININDTTNNESYSVMSGLQNQPLANGAQVKDIVLDLHDSTDNALDSPALTATPPDISGFRYHGLTILGDNAAGTASFQVSARLTAIKLHDPSSNNDPLVTYRITAMISEVSDPAGALEGTVTNGDMIIGTYRFDPATPDLITSTVYGEYMHDPASGDYGFNLSVGGHSLKTVPGLGEFYLWTTNDGDFGDDHFGADSYLGNLPLANGATVRSITFLLLDPTGNALASDAIPDKPIDLSQWLHKDMIVLGQHSNGIDYYRVDATILSMKIANLGPEISPAASTFDAMQGFDVALIFDPWIAPVAHLSGTLNGLVIDDYLNGCIAGAPNGQDRQTFVCSGFSSQLKPGINILKVTAELEDGTIQTNSVTWEVLSF